MFIIRASIRENRPTFIRSPLKNASIRINLISNRIYSLWREPSNFSPVTLSFLRKLEKLGARKYSLEIFVIARNCMLGSWPK